MPRAALTAVLTAAAMLAFAANSLLGRAALAGGHADAASFTTLRLAAGALALGALAGHAAARRRPRAPPGARRWRSSPTRIAFSLAYLRIPAGSGSAAALRRRPAHDDRRGPARRRASAGPRMGRPRRVARRPRAAHPTGPDRARSDRRGADARRRGGLGCLLAARTRRRDAVAANASSFARAVPLALATSAAFALLAATRLTLAGALLAIASGALTSGLGYAVWYAALRGLSATRAAIVQLSVPPLAALGGVLVLGEELSLRLVLASALILGGIALAIFGHRRSASSRFDAPSPDG